MYKAKTLRLIYRRSASEGVWLLQKLIEIKSDIIRIKTYFQCKTENKARLNLEYLLCIYTFCVQM